MEIVLNILNAFRHAIFFATEQAEGTKCFKSGVTSRRQPNVNQGSGREAYYVQDQDLRRFVRSPAELRHGRQEARRRIQRSGSTFWQLALFQQRAISARSCWFAGTVYKSLLLRHVPRYISLINANINSYICTVEFGHQNLSPQARVAVQKWRYGIKIYWSS